MKWNKIASYILLNLLVSGILSSGDYAGTSLIPACLSEELPAVQSPDDPDSIHAWEQELLAFVNQERIHKGLPPLDIDETLMSLARNHSNAMARQGFISHDQPSGNLQSRMGQAGYRYEVARENVASAPTVPMAHKALLKSPPHKSNILAGDVTHIGIGVVRYPSLCGEYMYITEVFASPRDEYQPAMMQNALERKIDELRHPESGAMNPDPLLDELASRSLSALNSPYDRAALKNLIAESAGELQKYGSAELSRLEFQVQVLHNPEKLNIPASNLTGHTRKYGAAVRQITDSRNQPAFLVLTLLGTAY